MSQSQRKVESVLLVCCCRPAQFAFALSKLRAARPDWRVSVLAADTPETRQRLESEPGLEALLWLGKQFEPSQVGCDRVVFPLLNRGFARVKRVARSIQAEAWEMDYTGSLRPLRAARLRASLFRSPNRATREFQDFLRDLPPPVLNGNVLVIHSADRNLVQSARPRWERALADGAEVTTVADTIGWREFRSLRRRDFNAALVFLSGERGFLRLKCLPFLLRIPRILAFNEVAVHHLIEARSIPGLIAHRLVHGISAPVPKPRILVIQTDTASYVIHAIKRLKEPRLHPNSEIVLLCRHDDRRVFEEMPEISRVMTYRSAFGWENIRLWLELRRLRPDMVSAVFTGRNMFRPAKALFFSFADTPLLAFNAGLDSYRVSPRTIPHLFRKDIPVLEGPLPRGVPVLVLQTESWQYTLEAIRELRGPKIHPAAVVSVVCRKRDRDRFLGEPGVDRVESFEDGWSEGPIRFLRRLRRSRPKSAMAVFARRKVFWKQKALFLLLGKRKIVFNARLDAFRLTFRTLPKLLRRVPPILDEHGFRVKGAPVLVIQTEHWQYVIAAIRELRGPTLYPEARVSVLCSEPDRDRFKAEPGVRRVESFNSARSEGWWKVWRRLRRERPEVIAAVMTGRPVFRKAKLFFLSFLGRPRLVFNANLGAYWLGLRSLPRLWRREPLLFGLRGAEATSEALLIQSESVETTREAIDVMLSGRVIPQSQIALFCRRDAEPLLANHPGVARVYTWAPGSTIENLRTIWRMFRIRRDVSAAILSGRSVFRPQKLLFFLLPTRERLVINENLDCFYLKRSRLARRLRLPSLHAPRDHHQSAAMLLTRQCAKALLFLPRFAYLSGWLLLAKLRRSRQLGG